MFSLWLLAVPVLCVHDIHVCLNVADQFLESPVLLGVRHGCILSIRSQVKHLPSFFENNPTTIKVSNIPHGNFTAEGSAYFF